MERVAIMDWDNTIRRGWTIHDWALHLEGQGLVSGDTVANIEHVLAQYASGRCGYSDMATTVLKAMAQGLKGQSVAAVTAQAPPFIKQDQVNVFPFAVEALRELRTRGLSLIVVSGAPEEVLNAAAREYGFIRVFGSVFDVQDGKYAGTVGRNRATIEGKETAVAPLLKGSIATIAIGDSEADLPLLERARLRIIVGNEILAERLHGSLLIDPEKPDISALLDAVDGS